MGHRVRRGRRVRGHAQAGHRVPDGRRSLSPPHQLGTAASAGADRHAGSADAGSRDGVRATLATGGWIHASDATRARVHAATPTDVLAASPNRGSGAARATRAHGTRSRADRAHRARTSRRRPARAPPGGRTPQARRRRSQRSGEHLEHALPPGRVGRSGDAIAPAVRVRMARAAVADAVRAHRRAAAGRRAIRHHRGAHRVQAAGIAKPRGVYVVVRIGLTNKGDAISQTTPGDFTAIDSAGIQYTAESLQSDVYASPRNSTPYVWPQSFPTGRTVTTQLIFDVDPAAKGLQLVIADVPKTRVRLD